MADDGAPGSPDIETLGTRTVYTNPWMRVREDEIRYRDGSTSTYGVVERADYVAVVPLDAGRLHLVEQFRYPVGARYWEIPQGTVEPCGDSDPAAVARIELAQETGLSAGSLVHAGRLFQSYGFTPIAYDVFLATELVPGTAALEREEQDLITRAFDLGEVERMIRNGVIRDGSTVAALGLLRLKGML